MTEKRGRKRSRSAAATADADGKLTRRQKRALAAKAPYFAPKPSSSIHRIEVPPEDLTPQQRIDLIADLSESILEDPTAALTSSRTSASGAPRGRGDDDDAEPGAKKEPQYHKTQSKMNKLLDLASLSTNGYDGHAARLAMLSLLAIFQDILPSYRIRLPTEAEMSVRVTKETKATWDHERKLLQAYQRYLQLLEKTWEDEKFGRSWSLDAGKKGNATRGPPTTLAATAILSLSALLQTCYNFNFRSNLLSIVVRQANNRSSEEVRASCCGALKTVFAKDVQGEVTLEAVRLMAKTIKQQSSGSRGSHVHPNMIDAWLSLPLRVHEDEAAAAKLASAAKAKKARKSQAGKEMLDIERDLKEGEGTVDKLELAKNQADCLHTVTLTYFRLLKTVANSASGEGDEGRRNHNNSAAVSELLPCALLGLAKFSHLIHLDAVVDLLAVLKDLLRDNASGLPVDAAVHCILCALKTLRGPGRETLPVDPKEYLIPLYGLLPRLGTSKDESVGGSNDALKGGSDVIEAVIQCLDHAFLQRRELSTARLAAFLKRLASASLHCTPQSATPLLACARQVSARYSSSKVERMLENEEDVVAEGMYAPDAEDPEHSNAHATSLWELALLKYSIHPRLAEHSLAMAEGRLLKMPAEAPGKLWASLGRDAHEAYIAQRAVFKRHPLDHRVLDNATVAGGSRRMRRQRRNQNQIRFITPRRTGNWHLLPVTAFTML
ncbi:hypothetical protein ACHAWF_014221 [Thalassiosira exigua]